MKTFHKIAVLAVVAAGLVLGTSAGQADAGFPGKFQHKKQFSGKFIGHKFNHHKFQFTGHKFQQHNFKHFDHKFTGHKFTGHKFNNGFKFNSHLKLHFGKR